MKRFLTVIFLFITVSTVKANTGNISNLFIQYLQQVHKIENPPNDQTYIIIDLLGCPPCVVWYSQEVENIFNDKKRKSFPSLIVVGNSEKPPDWLNSISKNHKNVYYDSKRFYHRINVTPNNSGIVTVKDGKIIERKIIKMENYKKLFESIE